MAYPPHRHSRVPGGALAPDGSPWLTPRYAAWLGPVQALATRFRGKVQEALRPTGLLAPVPRQVWRQGWMTHGQPAGTGAEGLASCAPSLSRIAITKHRLVQGEDGSVTCRSKARTSPLGTHRTLPAAACMRRFLPHVLPQRCMQVRSDGVLSPPGAQRWRRAGHAAPWGPPLPPPPSAVTPETVMSPLSPRRRPGTAAHAVSHSSCCSVCSPTQTGHRHAGEK
jgi:Putative transposase